MSWGFLERRRDVWKSSRFAAISEAFTASPDLAAATGRTGPAARPTHLSDDSETLPDQRHAVKGFIPIFDGV
jgi:hypothetical protein